MMKATFFKLWAQV